MGSTAHEFRQIFRKLVKTPGFSVVAVLTLAVGIGANTAIFSVVDGVLLRPLPYPDSDRLVGLWHTAPGLDLLQFEQSNTTYTLYSERAQSFEEIGLAGRTGHTLTGSGRAGQDDASRKGLLDRTRRSHHPRTTVGLCVDVRAGRGHCQQRRGE